MKHTLRLSLAVSALAAGLASAATVVTPVGVTGTIASDAGGSVNYLLVDNGGFTEASLQNPLGTAVTLPTGTDLAVALGTYHARSASAHAESWTRSIGSGNPVFTFDLGGDTDIFTVLLWQYGNNGGSGADDQGNSTRDFSLMFKTEAEGNDFSTWVPEFTGTMDSIAGNDTIDNVAQNFGFSDIENARYVGLRIDNNYGGQPGINSGGDRYGLGEVRFSIPEPTTSLLGALGLLALLRRRR